MLTKGVSVGIIIEHCSSAQTICGGIAQLARAFGSYPKGHVFESHLRYQQKRTVYKNSSFFMYFNKNNGKGRKKFFINKNCNFMK